MTEKRINNTSFRVEPSIMERLRQYCEYHGVKLGWFVTQAIRERLERVDVPRGTIERQR